MTDQVQKDLVLIAPWLKNREPFILVGPDGCGKATLIEHCLKKISGAQVAAVSCNAQTNAANVIQKLVQVGMKCMEGLKQCETHGCQGRDQHHHHESESCECVSRSARLSLSIALDLLLTDPLPPYSCRSVASPSPQTRARPSGPPTTPASSSTSRTSTSLVPTSTRPPSSSPSSSSSSPTRATTTNTSSSSRSSASRSSHRLAPPPLLGGMPSPPGSPRGRGWLT